MHTEKSYYYSLLQRKKSEAWITAIIDKDMEDMIINTNIFEKFKPLVSTCQAIHDFKTPKIKLFGRVRPRGHNGLNENLNKFHQGLTFGVSFCITFSGTIKCRFCVRMRALSFSRGMDSLLTDSRCKIERERYIINWTFTMTLNLAARVRKKDNGWEGMGLGGVNCVECMKEDRGGELKKSERWVANPVYQKFHHYMPLIF